MRVGDDRPEPSSSSRHAPKYAIEKNVSCLRRRLRKRKSASRTSSVFRLNPSLSFTSTIERVGWCWLWRSRFGSLQGQSQGRSLAVSRVHLYQILTISVMESSLDVRADSHECLAHAGTRKTRERKG